MFKSILRKAWVQNALATIVAKYMVLIKHTTRWTYIGREHVDPVWESSEGIILCIWHGRSLMALSSWPVKKQKTCALVSKSNDGDFIANVFSRANIGNFRGSKQRQGSSKDRGGSTALKQMVRHVRNKGCVAITPDGPRGPRMRIGEGPVRLAKMAGVAIQPCAISTKNAITLKSWDRFMVPLPFGRGIIIYSDPIIVPRDSDDDAIAQIRARFEERLITTTQQADAHFGKMIIQPADIAKKARR